MSRYDPLSPLPITRENSLLLCPSIAPAFLTASLVFGSIKPLQAKLGRVGDGMIMAACVISGTLGVVGMLA